MARILAKGLRLPLRAGRGEPIVPGPAQERKVRGRGLMPRFFVGRGCVKPKSCSRNRKDDKGAIACERQHICMTKRMFRRRSSLKGEGIYDFTLFRGI